MADHPSHGPLGSKPVLPAPQGASAARGASLFERFLAEERQSAGGASRRSQPPPAAAPSLRSDIPLPAPNSFGGGRRYDAALAAIADLAPEMALATPAEPDPTGPSTVDVATLAGGRAPTPYDENSEAVTQTAALRSAEPAAPAEPDEPDEPSGAVPSRPPPFAPTVRPSAPQPTGPAAVPQDVLEATAESALLMNDADGGTSFDIAIRDEVFSDLSCRVSVQEGRVVAVFRVADTNLRRLLESEAGRLRANLESRGLRVADVRVEVG